MDYKEIIQIIKACQTHGVDHFVHGELCISFRQKDLVETSPKVLKISAKTEQLQALATQEADNRVNLEEAEEELAELMINHPEEYEARIASGELVDEARLQH